MAKFPKKLAQKIEERAAINALRSLAVARKSVDFSSNDYLGFSRNLGLGKRALKILTEEHHFQNGATGSRLLTGNHQLYERLETYLAKFHEAGSALVFNSGYDANLGFFSSVPQRHDIVLYDEFCHASIRDGIKLGNAKSYKFKHNDFGYLNAKLRSLRAESRSLEAEIYLVTESVFSMDGDSPNLKTLARICTKNGLRLVVDEAHAVGIYGKGLVNELDLEDAIFARIITFGKALGCHGAAILGSRELKTYLVNFARSLIYTTALSPYSVAMVLTAYEELDSEHGQKLMIQLRENINFFTMEINKNDLTSYFKQSDSAIQICELGGNDRVKKLSKILVEKGFDVKPILAPTIPKGSERLRLCIHAFNTRDEMKEVLQTIKTKL